MSDKLRFDYINSLPQPILVREYGSADPWPLYDIDVETGLLRFDVCGMLVKGHVGNVAEFIDADGNSHDPDSFYVESEQ